MKIHVFQLWIWNHLKQEPSVNAINPSADRFRNGIYLTIHGPKFIRIFLKMISGIVLTLKRMHVNLKVHSLSVFDFAEPLENNSILPPGNRPGSQKARDFCGNVSRASKKTNKTAYHIETFEVNRLWLDHAEKLLTCNFYKSLDHHGAKNNQNSVKSNQVQPIA